MITSKPTKRYTALLWYLLAWSVSLRPKVSLLTPLQPLMARRGSDPTLLESPPPNSSTVHIKDMSHLTLLDSQRAMCSLRDPPLDAAREATRQAEISGDAFLARIWGTLATLFDGEGKSMMETISAESALQEM